MIMITQDKFTDFTVKKSISCCIEINKPAILMNIPANPKSPDSDK